MDAAAHDEHEEGRRMRRARREVARTSPRTSTVCLVILTLLAVLAAMYVSAPILLPLLFAAVLNLLLAPAKRFLTERLRFPRVAAALLLLALVGGLISGVGSAVAVPATAWLGKAPQSLQTLQDRLGFLSEPLGFVRQAMDQIQQLGGSGGAEAQPGQQAVTVRQPHSSGLGGVGLTVLKGTRAALGQVLTLTVVLFFLLMSGDSLLRRLVEILPSFDDKRRVVEIAGEIEHNVSGYLATITLMNILVGIANGVSMWAQGMPDPLLWGTLAFLLNYVPILGPLTGVVIFFFVGLFSTTGIWPALLPPAVYLVIHVMEGETITPMLLARRFTLNPVLVIVSLFFWDWLWGVPGALLSVPLLAILKIVADRIPALMPLGHILGAGPEPVETKVAANGTA
jgi:predicted PurR-regulated permease PerM